jgi:hypothetical protein
VALEATPADLEILAGDWAGEYESAALNRNGTIEFKLKAGTDEAFGNVLMVPREQPTSYRREPYHEGALGQGVTGTTEFLTIRFIRASNGAITGMLDRYWDPDRGCYATTVFRGFTGLGVVEGTFKTTFDCGAGEAQGNWRVARKSARR